LDEARQRSLETCQSAFPRPRLAFICIWSSKSSWLACGKSLRYRLEAMCGRFTLRTRDRIKLKGLSTSALPFEARYNIAPSQMIATIADFGRGTELGSLVWGLIPSWSRNGKGFINARCETLETKPSFSESFQRRRCLIPADGFFEWKRVGGSKQPYYFQLKDESPFAFAGIWDRSRNGKVLTISCAIITTTANELVEPLHDRIPVMLKPESYVIWLSPQTDAMALKKMLVPFPASIMLSHPVSSSVNYPENEVRDLISRSDA